MNQLIQIYRRLLDEVTPKYYRDFYRTFTMENRLVGVVGARGVGKTTFLLQYLREQYADSEKGLYISADNIYFADHTLFETVDLFVKNYGGDLLCIDEIHKYKNWNQELKNIYDSYPKLQVLFSGSSSIDIIKGKYDLSRRVIVHHMYGFSFREYLEYTTGKKFSILSLDQILRSTKQTGKKIGHTVKLLGHFHEYWKKGYYPSSFDFSTYEAFADSLLGIIDKTIFEDISSFYALKTENLDALKKLIYFFATSTPGSINVNNLARSLKKDNATIASYIQMLKDSGLLRFLLYDTYGHALVRNAEKIYIDNTNLLYAINHAIGKETHIGSVREVFTVASLEQAGYPVFYSKQGDIVCKGNVFEIGGEGKKGKQLKNLSNAFVFKDDIVYGTRNILPLHLLGFLR